MREEVHSDYHNGITYRATYDDFTDEGVIYKKYTHQIHVPETFVGYFNQHSRLSDIERIYGVTIASTITRLMRITTPSQYLSGSIGNPLGMTGTSGGPGLTGVSEIEKKNKKLLLL